MDRNGQSMPAVAEFVENGERRSTHPFSPQPGSGLPISVIPPRAGIERVAAATVDKTVKK